MRNRLKDFPLRDASHSGHALAYLLPTKPDSKMKEDEWLAYLLCKDPDQPSKQAKTAQEQYQFCLKTVCVGSSTPSVYETVFQRWQAALAEALLMRATTRGPLAIGLGNASPYEVGLTLHHTYGVPYLPASALKGLARRVALELKKQGKLSDEAIKTLFGDIDTAGYVTFWDGWLEPQKGPILQLDTITVHHPKYYGKGEEWPTDFDDPTPLPFLSVRAGLRFELRVSGPSDWAVLALQLLQYGLENYGLGGKTNAGYGGFDCDREKSEAEQQAEAEAKAARERKRLADEQAKQYERRMRNLKTRIERANMGNPKPEWNWLKTQITDLPQELGHEVMQLFLNRVQASGRSKERDIKKLIREIETTLEEAKRGEEEV